MTTHKEDVNFLTNWIKTWSNWIAVDFLQCVDQKTRTTKLSRREKAVAYVIESMTGDPDFKTSEKEIIGLLGIIEKLIANAGSDEAKTALKRAEKRLRWKLEHPMEIYGNARCVACNEVYPRDESHECTSVASKQKDASLARNPDVMI